MGNRLTFELGADIDASVTNAGKRLRDVLEATAAIMPGWNVQTKILGDTMRLTLTEAKKAADAASHSMRHAITVDKLRVAGLEAMRRLDAEAAAATAKRRTELEKLAIAAKRATEAEFDSRFVGIDALRGSALATMRGLDAAALAAAKKGVTDLGDSMRMTQLMFFEGGRAVQDFVQVVGQQGFSGGIRAAANNLQRLAEIASFAIPGLGMTARVAMMVGTTALVPLADYFSRVSTKVKEADKDTEGFVRRLYDLKTITMGLAGREAEVAEQGQATASRAAIHAAGQAVTQIQAAIAKTGLTAADIPRAKEQLRDMERMPGLPDAESEVAMEAERQNLRERIRTAEALQRQHAGAVQRRDELMRLEAERQERSQRKAALAQSEQRRDAIRRGAEIPGQIVSAAEAAAVAPFGPRRKALGERQARLDIEMQDFEAAGRDAEGRGRPMTRERKQAQAELRRRQDVMQGEERKLAVETAEAAKQGAANGAAQVELLKMAVQYSLRYPIVPPIYINR